MSPKLLFTISTLLFSCNNHQATKNDRSSPTKDSNTNKIAILEKSENQKANIGSDTASTDYLIYLLKNEIDLNEYWTQKLKMLDVFALPLDSMSRLSIIRDWVINDSISVIILSHSTGTSYDEFLLTVTNKKDFVSKIHISDLADSDLSLENPYYYIEHKLINDRKVKLFNHKVVVVKGGEEKDKILSIENWSILDNGEVQIK